MGEDNGCDAKPSGLEAKIIRQVEYYFGDINLARDKFLQAEIKTDEGWVTLATMLKFNRLRQLTEEEDKVCAALRKSSSGLIEVSEDGKKIRRTPERPLPELTQERRSDLKWKSIYAKGFPLDAPLDDLLTYFNQFGDTEHVQMRRDKKHDFKGSCMVIYGTVEAAKKFVEGDSIKFKDVELISKMFKHDYFDMKSNDRKKEIKQKDDNEKQQEEEEQDEYVKSRMSTGAILYVEGLDNRTMREDLKKAFVPFGLTVSWVDLNQGDTKGRLRFDSQDGAKVALEKLKEANDGKAILNGNEVEARVLEGEEELDHWRKLYAQQKDMKDKKRRKRDVRGGGKRGGYRGGHRQSDRRKPADSESDDDAPPVKKVKSEDA